MILGCLRAVTCLTRFVFFCIFQQRFYVGEFATGPVGICVCVCVCVHFNSYVAFVLCIRRVRCDCDFMACNATVSVCAAQADTSAYPIGALCVSPLALLDPGLEYGFLIFHER